MATNPFSPNILLPHGFLSREGGVSTGLYQSLNCGPGSQDDPDNVAENRRIAASLIAKRRDTPLLSLYQIHSADVVIATDNWGADRPKADGMVTNHRGLILGILTADCTPVLFADEKNHVIGAAHAGWKGALGGVLENTITEMLTLGAEKQHIKAAIGPCIHQPSYEVSAEFRDTFLAQSSDFSAFFNAGEKEEHYQFDLPGFVTTRLQTAGIASIWNADIDTYLSPCHFSFRRTTHRGEADYGRQLSAIMLP